MKSFVAQTVEALGEVELLVSSAGDMLRDSCTRSAPRPLQSRFRYTWSVPTGWPRPCYRPWWHAGEVTSSSSDPMWACANARIWCLRRRQGRSGRYGHQPADGVGRHRCSRIDRASGTHADRYGLAAVGRTSRPNAGGLGKVGQARHNYFLRPSDLARAIAFVAETPRGCVVVNMEIQPEAPLRMRPRTVRS